MPQISAPQPQTTPVRAAHRFDQAALERYLGEHVPEAVPIQGVSQFAAGQSNPTYLIEAPERRFVLRKKPPGALLPSAPSGGAGVSHPRRARRRPTCPCRVSITSARTPPSSARPST